MLKKIFSKSLSYLPQILAMLFLAGFVVYAWTEPGQAPPGGNVATPINVSNTDQSKLGGFGLGGGVGQALQWLKNIGGSLHIKNQGGTTNLFIGQDGKVGIGTENPQGQLDVGGGKLVVTTEGATNFTTGPNNPSAVVNEGGSYWNNPGNAMASDNNYAWAGSGDCCGSLGINSVVTNYLKVTGFNFSIPSTAIIDGIGLEVERYGIPAGYGQFWEYSKPWDSWVGLVKNGTIQGSNRANPNPWPTTDTSVSYGGLADKWGLTWLAGDINNSNFGAAIKVELAGDVDDGWGTAYIDHMRITVYYHTGGMDAVKVSNVTIAGDGSVSANLNADKLDSYDSADFLQIRPAGLYGQVVATAYLSQWCQCNIVLAPTTCTPCANWQCFGNFACTITCPSGYTLIETASRQYNPDFGGTFTRYFSCYKQ